MNVARLVACLLLGMLACTPRPAAAQTAWPSKPVRLLVGYSAGGPSDLIVRPLAQHLSKVLSSQFIVENRPGANANLAALEVVRAGPDGHALLFATTSQLTINPALYKMPYDPRSDLLPIIHISMNPSSVVMKSSFPAKSMKEVIALARANPGKLTYASAGVGSINHLAAELLSMTAKVKMLHVPMKGGGPALTELLAGWVDMFIVSPPVAIPHVQTGKLKIMMVSAPKRMAQLPDVPTMIEAGYAEFRAQAGTGLLAPARTAQAVVDRVYQETDRYLKSEAGAKLLNSQGVQIVAGSPEEFAEVIRSETQRWALVVQAGGIKVE